MTYLDKAKIFAGLFALCLLSSLMTPPEPVKYEKGTVTESAAHKAWVKRQNRDII